jgi:mannose-6-phosphate isomerase-like protein (cupin superfamily)
MFIVDLQSTPEFVAGDSTVLRELLHPAKADLTLRYSLAHALLPPGKASLPHRLRTSEVYFVIEGEGTMYINGEAASVRAGHAIYIPPHATQHIENTGDGDLKFLCIVDPAWRPEDEEVL